MSFALTVRMASVYHATNVRSMPPSAACATIFAEIVQSPFAGAAKHAAGVKSCVWNATAFVRNAVRSGANPAAFVRTAQALSALIVRSPALSAAHRERSFALLADFA